MFGPLGRYSIRLFTLESWQWWSWSHLPLPLPLSVSNKEGGTVSSPDTVLGAVLALSREPRLLLAWGGGLSLSLSVHVQRALLLCGGSLCAIAAAAFLDPLLDYRLTSLWRKYGANSIAGLFAAGLGAVCLQHAYAGVLHRQHGLGVTALLFAAGSTMLVLPITIRMKIIWECFLLILGASVTGILGSCSYACLLHYGDGSAAAVGCLATAASLSLNAVRCETVFGIQIVSPVLAVINQCVLSVYSQAAIISLSAKRRIVVPVLSCLKSIAASVYSRALLPVAKYSCNLTSYVLRGTKWAAREIYGRVLTPMATAAYEHAAWAWRGGRRVALGVRDQVAIPVAACARRTAGLAGRGLKRCLRFSYDTVLRLRPSAVFIANICVSSWRGAAQLTRRVHARAATRAGRLRAAVLATYSGAKGVAKSVYVSAMLPVANAGAHAIISAFRFLNSDLVWSLLNAVCVHQCVTCYAQSAEEGCRQRAVYAMGGALFAASSLTLLGSELIALSNKSLAYLRVRGSGSALGGAVAGRHSPGTAASSLCRALSAAAQTTRMFGEYSFLMGQLVHWVPLRCLRLCVDAACAVLLLACRGVHRTSQGVSSAFYAASQLTWRALKYPAEAIYAAIAQLLSSKWSTLGLGVCVLGGATQYETNNASLLRALCMALAERAVAQGGALAAHMHMCMNAIALPLPALQEQCIAALSLVLASVEDAIDPFKSMWAVFRSPLFMGALEAVLLTIHLVWDDRCGLYARLPRASRGDDRSASASDRCNWVKLMRVRSKLFVLPLLTLRILYATIALGMQSTVLLRLEISVSPIVSIVSVLTSHVLLIYLAVLLFVLLVGLRNLAQELVGLNGEHEAYLSAGDRQGDLSEDAMPACTCMSLSGDVGGELPDRVYNEAGCTICLQETDGGAHCVLACGHVFHLG
jgi:hypothetical protein